MVNSSILVVGFVILIAIVAFVFLLGNRGTALAKVSDVATIDDALRQVDLPVNASTSTQGLIGFSEGRVNSDNTVDQIKNNILSSNLITEESIRKLNEETLNKTQIATNTGGSGTQTKEIEGVLLASTPTSELRVLEAFAPAGEGEFLSIRGTPLAEGAKVRTEETFSGTLTTSTGTREIRGSKALFDRLQQNLLSNSN